MKVMHKESKKLEKYQIKDTIFLIEKLRPDINGNIRRKITIVSPNMDPLVLRGQVSDNVTRTCDALYDELMRGEL